MCDSLENYYQEAGRAGRDGKRSYAVLLAASDDTARIRRNFSTEFPPLDEIKSIYEKICSYLQIAIGDGLYASYVFNIHEFCAREHIYGGKVRAAIKLLQQNGYMTLTEELENPARIMFCVSRDDLYKIRINRQDLDHIIRTILRMYNGVFMEFKAIDEREIATTSGYAAERVKELLKIMWQQRIIRYIPSNTSPMIFMDEERLPVQDIYISPETYLLRQRYMEERFNNMIEYANNEDECRSIILQRYFSDNEAVPCGICDRCLATRRQHAAADKSLNDKILELLKQAPLSARDIAREIKATPSAVATAIDELIAERKISTTQEGKLVIIE
jgi:ATP-dependent DNA helicase RecQ